MNSKNRFSPKANIGALIVAIALIAASFAVIIRFLPKQEALEQPPVQDAFPMQTSALSTTDEADFYIEVSNALGSQDVFAWNEYDHINYTDGYAASMYKHISYDENNIKMTGYGSVAYKDFLLVEDETDSKKVLSFDIKRDSTDWHSMEGGGFLFNTSIQNNTIQGFCVLVTQNGLKLVEITGVNVNNFRNGTYSNVQNAGRLLATYPIGNLYAEHRFTLEVNENVASLWDGDVLIIDKYELPDNDYGYGYGPITSHISHSCSQLSYFTFGNISMETVTRYYLKFALAEDEWDLINDYWTTTFTLTNTEYTPDDSVVVMELSDYPLFADVTNMVLFYPDGTYERIPWADGRADYENSEVYIDVLDYNLSRETRVLLPGEQIVGAYSEAN